MYISKELLFYSLIVTKDHAFVKESFISVAPP